MNLTTTLSDLKPGETATVSAMSDLGDIRRRLLDIGLVKDATVECVGISPLGDPSAYRILGAVIAIRRRDARHISVKKTGVASWA